MLIPQLYGRPFIDVLAQEFVSAERVDIASAWARASGVGLLWPSLTKLLDRGGSFRAVVGLDQDNTSIEGLSMLLDLEGDVRLWVRHNEGSPIFHPKLYAFRSSAECRLFVGSNNMTGAGLSANEELSARLAETCGGALEAALDAYLSDLTDVQTDLVKPLNPALLSELTERKYVLPEARLRGKSANRHNSRPKHQRLFGAKSGSRRRIAPSVPVPGVLEPIPTAPAVDWKRVFVRLRLSRGTQGQLPVAIVREIRRRRGETALDGPLSVIDRNSNQTRMISPAYSGSQSHANTYKFEAFEPEKGVVVEFEMIDDQPVFEQLDTASPAGALIERFLLAGLEADPPMTSSTTSDLSTATLYRFD